MPALAATRRGRTTCIQRYGRGVTAGMRGLTNPPQAAPRIATVRAGADLAVRAHSGPSRLGGGGEGEEVDPGVPPPSHAGHDANDDGQSEDRGDDHRPCDVGPPEAVPSGPRQPDS